MPQPSEKFKIKTYEIKFLTLKLLLDNILERKIHKRGFISGTRFARSRTCVNVYPP
jgi:hypothetical protein